jgi:hypothetical protein
MQNSELLLRLVYASRATKEMPFNRVLTIVAKSHSANKARDITGILLYDRGVFLQTLEGPAEAVRGLYAAIARDTRHQDLKVLLEERITTRLFAGWSMGHSEATLPDIAALPGINAFFVDGHDLSDLGETQVRHMLDAFRAGQLGLKTA